MKIYRNLKKHLTTWNGAKMFFHKINSLKDNLIHFFKKEKDAEYESEREKFHITYLIFNFNNIISKMLKIKKTITFSCNCNFILTIAM